MGVPEVCAWLIPIRDRSRFIAVRLGIAVLKDGFICPLAAYQKLGIVQDSGHTTT